MLYGLDVLRIAYQRMSLGGGRMWRGCFMTLYTKKVALRFFAIKNSSADFLSVIFGTYGKFHVDILGVRSSKNIIFRRKSLIFLQICRPSKIPSRTIGIPLVNRCVGLGPHCLQPAMHINDAKPYKMCTNHPFFIIPSTTCQPRR